MRYVLLAVALALASSCYDPKSPNLPPCPKDAAWPDPCFGAYELPKQDAGK